jgi:hypothetical protein
MATFLRNEFAMAVPLLAIASIQNEKGFVNWFHRTTRQYSVNEVIDPGDYFKSTIYFEHGLVYMLNDNKNLISFIYPI